MITGCGASLAQIEELTSRFTEMTSACAAKGGVACDKATACQNAARPVVMQTSNTATTYAAARAACEIP